MIEILVPTSPGELLDKLTILQLKSDKITDPGKLANIEHEQQVLQKIADTTLPNDPILDHLRDDLFATNGDLWVIEDDIRMFEAKKDFGPGFIALARAVYVTNDKRAALKKQINQHLGSDLIEEKSYAGGDDT